MKTIDIFPWNEHFNTGLVSIDKQHKKLVAILNSLASYIAYSSNENELNIIFDELTNYTIYHFETEEAIWRKYLHTDPLNCEHQSIHQQFIDTIKKLKLEQNSRPLLELAEEALDFLTRWLVSHILESDRFMSHLVFALKEGLSSDAAKKYANEKMNGSSAVFIEIILSIYSTLSTNNLRLMRELKSHKNLEKIVDTQDKYRDILLELSTDFINLPLDEIDYNINKALEKMAKSVNADRAYIFEYDYELQTTTNTYEWCATEIIPQINELQNISINSIFGWPEIHARGEYILIQDVSALEEGPLRDLLFPQQIISLVTFPLFENSKCSGFVGFDAVKAKHIFSTSEIGILEIFSKLLSNISDRKKLEQNLIKERNLFEKYLNTVESIIVSLDVKGNITLVNRKACQVLGYTAEELIGQQWFKICLIQPEGITQIYPIFEQIISGKIKGSEYYENYIITKSREKYLIAWHNSYFMDEQGNIIGLLSSGEDITLLKKQQERLEHMAHFDTLTNLPNRVLLSDRLKQAILYAKRYESSLAVIYLDLDGFKEINDTFGHENGDILLKVISNRTQEILRESDTLARLGGDEFAIILHDLKNKQDCFLMLKRILNVMSAPVFSKEIVMQVSASMGVTFFNQNDIVDADQLLRQADHAMYQAKLSGKNRFHIFDVEEDKNLRIHNESLQAIERALNNNEFLMYYQPKVNMRSGEFLGAEALIRWNHPVKGLLFPGAFLPVIENHNLSANLDSWVIKNVMEQIQKWKKEGINIVVSINISAIKLQESNFVNNLLLLLSDYPEVRTSDFIFEILETSALEDMNRVSYIMKECNKIGIDFSLDDFGTGYSSLSYLKSLPAKELKIDKSFVRDMLVDIDDMAILEGVIGLANAFRREVIAEGVESIEQGKMLLQLGCEKAQGYIIAKPMPAQKLSAWIKTWQVYPQWQNIKALSRDDIPTLYAIVEHEIWIKKVIAYIKKEESEFPILDCTQCRFGKWLYDQDMKNKVIQEIEKLHIQVHNNIQIIIKEYMNNSNEHIEVVVKKILDNRDKFLEEFKKLFLLD